MTAPATSEPATPVATPPRSFWQRRLIDPIARQLTQGVTPAKITFTLAVSSVCSLFPFLGFTWLLNLVVGLPLRLNQPIMQTLNQVMTPVHLPMIVVYVKVGEWIWGAGDDRFTLTDMLTTFRDQSIGEFLQRFGWAGIHALTAWAISAPLIIIALYYPLRPLMHRLTALRKTPAA